MSKNKATISPELYEVLRYPLITEKATLAAEQNKFSFKVSLDSTKVNIKSAVESLFGVNVKSVNTILVKGKRKLFKGRKGVRSDYKKAIVTLKDGQSIDFSAGVR